MSSKSSKKINNASRISLLMPIPLQKELAEVADRKGVTRSELVRTVLQWYVNHEHAKVNTDELNRGHTDAPRAVESV